LTLRALDIVSGVETCYRHPDRETGVSCSSCGRPICPECMTPTPVGMRCPECSRQRTKVRTAQSLTDEPRATYVLMAICIVLALGDMFSGGTSDILRQGGVNGPDVADGEYWRIVTAGFLHAGLIHLLFNMYALYILGTMLEPAIGRMRFLLIYFVSLLCGSFGALLLSPDANTVGASGAVFGLMGAAIAVMRNRGIDPMASGLPFWLGINLLITFTIPNISVGGHIGGLIGGALTAVVLFDIPDRVRLPQVVPALAAGALGAAAVVGSIMVV
jgi:membrane associated rhomboid family serine protease